MVQFWLILNIVGIRQLGIISGIEYCPRPSTRYHLRASLQRIPVTTSSLPSP